MCVCGCVHACIRMWVYMFKCMCACVCMCARVCVYLCQYVSTQICLENSGVALSCTSCAKIENVRVPLKIYEICVFPFLLSETVNPTRHSDSAQLVLICCIH